MPEPVTRTIEAVLSKNLDQDIMQWLQQRVEAIVAAKTARELFLGYSMLSQKIEADPVNYKGGENEILQYLTRHSADRRQLARFYLLARVLEEDANFFTPKVSQLIQVGDTGEMQTFLRYLYYLPQAADFSPVAADALRTNIATIFDALAMDNPYPAAYFTDQQWNQMYLKAAFMQRNLGGIRDIDKRANKDLARIISDYAHERWAAGRDVDPEFWRPVTRFIDKGIITDMERLLNSSNYKENIAGALCCFHSGSQEARALLENYPELYNKIKEKQVDWDRLKD